MRLTLRTLLAYMDDILDPADQHDLARQVEESENATELIHRTRDATRRLRLGAPPVIGDGMELDPNCVAEYLDNTMAPEDMTEFQQVCLDSDVHLAEVASCHHILTMVLGEPAEIEPEMRQKMYDIPGRVDEWRKLRLDGPHRVSSAPETIAAPALRSDSGEDEPITEVPDYLKAGESSTFGKMALAFAAALVLGFGAFMLFGPGGMLADDNELAQNNASANTPAEPGDDVAGELSPAPDAVPLPVPVSPVPDATAASESPQPNIDVADNDAAAFDLPPLAGDLPAGEGLAENSDPEIAVPSELTQPADMLADVAPPNVEAPVADAVAATDVDTALDTANNLPGEGDTATDSVAPDRAAMAANIDSPVALPAGMPADDTADAVADAVNGNADRVAMNTTNEPIQMPDTVSADAVAPEAADFSPAEAAPLGTMVSPTQVLLRWDSLGGKWTRMPSRSSIAAGDQLMSLPTYRPSLALVSGLRVEFSDGATMSVDYASDGKTLRLDVTYGRFLLQNTDMEPVEVELAIGGESKRVELESTAVLGLDVDRPFVSGADVEKSVGTFVAHLYAPEGKVVWNVGTNPLPVVTASQWAWGDAAAGSITDDVSWLNGQSLDYLLQNVSRNFEKQFDTERPARLQLLEFYETSRRREEKALAAQSGTHVGQFVPFVQALADTQQQSNWGTHVAELRRAMSRSTQAATLVHETLTEQRGAALADDLFAMLRGYSPEDIGSTREEVQSGITRQLIDWLQHNRLEYRVLAIHNLKQIYGGKTLGYNPVVTEPNRQERAVRSWRTRLADNELVPVYLQ